MAEGNNKLMTKVIMLLLATVIGMAGWYFKALTEEVKGLREDVVRIRIAVEVQAGGDPFAEDP